MADVSPGGFSSAYSAANTGDTLELLAGTHVTSGRQSIAKRLIIKAKDWDANTTPGKYVTGSTGHLLSDFQTVWQGSWSITAAQTVFRGIAFEGRATSGAGSVDINADDIVFEDCRFSDGFRYIMCHIGSTAPRSRIIFRRCRFTQIGARYSHDHPIYAKTARNCVVEDCLFYNNAGWAFHCYTDCDDLIVRRCVVDRSNGGVTFSGDSANTVLGGYQFSTNNVVEDSIFTNCLGPSLGSTGTKQQMYLAGVYYPGTAGTNTLRRSDFWNSSTPSQAGRIQSTSAITVESTVIDSNPGYANPTGGDFTLSSSSPALGMGPTQIQPGGSPPSPPDPVTNLTATPGTTSVALSWTNPSSTITSIEVRRGTSTFPADVTDGISVYSGTGTSVTDTGLSEETTYRYSVFAVNGNLVSSAAQVAAVTGGGTPPPPDDPTGGAEHFGKTSIGGTWRGMSGDYKRASRFTVPAGKQVTSIGVYLRGNGTSGTQSVRPFIYNDATGALLGTCTAQDISNTATAAWVTFTPVSAIACPSNGGTVRLGLHTTAGDVQIATDVVTGALAHGSDTYSDGTAATWTDPATDQYELSIYALTEDVPSSSELSAGATLTFTASGDLTEETPGSTAITDVVYRMVAVQRTYVIPTPFQVSTGAELEWDSANSKFIYKGSG